MVNVVVVSAVIVRQVPSTAMESPIFFLLDRMPGASIVSRVIASFISGVFVVVSGTVSICRIFPSS